VSLWRQITRGLRVLADRSAADRELAEELKHFADLAAAAQIAQGASASDARRAVRIEMGDTTTVREEVRSHGWEHYVDTFLTDLRYATRRLRNSPGFTTVSVITLALGIGASTAIFSAVHPILFASLPYPNADRLAMIWYADKDGARADQTFGTYREVAARSRTFEAVAVYKPWQRTLGDNGSAEPERFDGQLVSATFFRVLGVEPAIGRGFDATEDRPNGPNVVVISNALWHRRFNGDASIVGRRITLNDYAYTVVGVMPRDFENVLAPAADMWSPLQYDPSLPPESREWGHHLRMVGRVRAGFSLEQGARELNEIARHPAAEFARANGSSMSNGLIVSGLQDDLARGVKPALLAVFVAALLLLAIACVNVTNLLLARTVRRRSELAMRAALGAGTGRLVRQLLTETVLLAITGGVLGLAVARMGVAGLVALSPSELPRAASIRVDTAAFAFALGVATLIGIMVGLAPALHASHHDLGARLREGSRRTAGSHRVTRGALAVAEVALALMLLVGAGLLLRSLERIFAVASGFDASHVITMQIQVSSPKRYPNGEAFLRYFAELVAAVNRVNGVQSAALTSELPLAEDGHLETYCGTIEKEDDRTGSTCAVRYAVTPEYFSTLKIPLRRGRLLDEHDIADASPRAVLVNESFAKRKFPGQDAVGQRVRYGGLANRPWDVIVGVVGDVRQASLTNQSEAIYVSEYQWLWADNPMWLVVRTRGDAAALAPMIRAAIWSVNRDQPLARVATMDHLLAASEAKRRFALVVFEAFAGVALVLAAVGIYGVLSGGVTERLREIGVRAALGASPGDILALIIRQGMTLTMIGVAIGAVSAAAATRALTTLIYGVAAADPVTYASVVILLVAVSIVACWIPATRAARVDPTMTLRAE
jgi:putative ABC transport system permease protein